MDYTKLQDQLIESDFSADGDVGFEYASAKKKKRQAGRKERKAKRQEKRATKAAKKGNKARANRLNKKASSNRAKANKLKGKKSTTPTAKKVGTGAARPKKKSGGLFSRLKSKQKAAVKRKQVSRKGKDVTASPVSTSSGEQVDPILSESGEELYTPQVVEPIEMETTDYDDGGVQTERIEPEITDSGEVMTPEIVETSEEPQENEDGSISVGDETIEPEMSEDGEAYEPEVVDEEEGADGETVYKILRYNKIPATRNADGNVIMPYKMADGSVVLTDEIYSSATGEIYTNADGDTVVKNAKTIKGAKESNININLPENKWAKYATYGLAAVGLAAVAVYGWKVYNQYKK